jgi:RNA polymerase sigma-70 factor, ECF subfamily
MDEQTHDGLVGLGSDRKHNGEEALAARPPRPKQLPEASGPVPVIDLTARQRPRREPRLAEEAEVLAALARRDHDGALVLLMRHFGKPVYQFVRGMVRNDALADDVHQVVFIQAHRDFDSFEGKNLTAWLFAIARNRSLDALRAQHRWTDRCQDDEVDTVDAEQIPADVQVDDHRRLVALGTCIDTLSTESRTTLLLRCLEGFSFEEMAKMLRERAGTLQQRVARALPFLRRCIEQRLQVTK